MPVSEHLPVFNEADQSSFQFYLSGVLTASRGVNIDHGVLALKTNTDASSVQWKVMNSWESPGESNHMRLFREKGVTSR